MKKLFCDDDGHLSMGRVLCLMLFIVCVGMWVYAKTTTEGLTEVDADLIKWGFITSIVGKGASKMAENLKK